MTSTLNSDTKKISWRNLIFLYVSAKRALRTEGRKKIHNIITNDEKHCEENYSQNSKSNCSNSHTLCMLWVAESIFEIWCNKIACILYIIKKQIVRREGTYFTIINCTDGEQLHTLKYRNQQFYDHLYWLCYHSCLLITSVISLSYTAYIVYRISMIIFKSVKTLSFLLSSSLRFSIQYSKHEIIGFSMNISD